MDPFVERHALAYPYERSLGKVLGAFFAGLRDGVVLGSRTEDGRVLVPPSEADPWTGHATVGLVPVSEHGVVTTWTPDGWALVLLDGADTAMLHRVEAPELRTGLRVRARWAAERVGSIHDIACFEAAEGCSTPTWTPSEPVRRLRTPSHLDTTHTASPPLRRFLAALAERRILGGRCPECRKVMVPLRATCPTCAAPIAEEVEVAHTGTVTTFCIVNIPFEGQLLPPPYACAHVLLDGADVPLFQIVRAPEVRMGLRVRVVWGDAVASHEAIRWFEAE